MFLPLSLGAYTLPTPLQEVPVVPGTALVEVPVPLLTETIDLIFRETHIGGHRSCLYHAELVEHVER